MGCIKTRHKCVLQSLAPDLNLASCASERLKGRKVSTQHTSGAIRLLLHFSDFSREQLWVGKKRRQ